MLERKETKPQQQKLICVNYATNNLTATLKYMLNGRCSNNQAEQMAILKALEYIQYSKAGEKTVLVFTDSRITLHY